jgi:hypothetical protein
MVNAISKFGSILIAIALLAIMPIYKQSWSAEQIVYNRVNNITSTISSRVREKGYISRDDYEELLSDLNNTNKFYEIKLLHRKREVYPLNESNPLYSKDKPFAELYDEYTEKDIFDVIYDKSSVKIYKMRVNDEFSIYVREKGVGPYYIIKDFLTGSDSKSMIFARYGGTVENEID